MSTSGLEARTLTGHLSPISSADNKNFRGPYKAPKFTGPEPKAVIEGGKVYTGSCHCGAVKVALKTKPLDKTSTETIMECNCSICNRVSIYIAKTSRDPGLTYYRWVTYGYILRKTRSRLKVKKISRTINLVPSWPRSLFVKHVGYRFITTYHRSPRRSSTSYPKACESSSGEGCRKHRLT